MGMDIKRIFSRHKVEVPAQDKPTAMDELMAMGEPGEKVTGRPLRYYYLFLFLGFTAALSIIGGGLFYLNQMERSENGKLTISAQARSVAQSISSWVEQQRVLVQAIADDPELASMFRAGDSEKLKRRAEEFTRLFPGSIGFELIPVDEVRAAAKGGEDMGYAALDLLRTATRTTGMPPLEVHRFGTPDAHVALVSRVPASGEQVAVGLVQVRLPLQSVERQLPQMKGFPGVLSLEQQPAGTGGVSLVSRGNPPQQPADGMVPIRDSIWRLAYWYVSGARNDFERPSQVWLVVALGWLLAGLFLFGHYRWFRPCLVKDLTQLMSGIQSKLKGKEITASKLNIQELAAAMEQLRQMTGELAVRSAAAGGLRQDTAQGEGIADNAFDSGGPTPSEAAGITSRVELPKEIFRSYDIRGVVGKSLTPEIMHLLGRAFASEALDRDERTVILGRDGRLSGPEFHAAFRAGLLAAGADVIDLGMVPTPLIYFATQFLASSSGAMITGSHNPADYNGVKLVMQGETFAGSALQGLRSRIIRGDLRQGAGDCLEQDLLPDYIARVTDDVQLARPLRVVVDCGNGVAGPSVLRLLRELGCDVIDLFCEVDGSFPNHHPDPGQPDNLLPLVMEVEAQEADLGLAFDGDGDRIAAVDGSGKIIWPDRLMMLLAEHVLAANPGADIVFDVKSSQNLATHIRSLSGCPVFSATGHSNLKAKARDIGAPLAGELSGHILFRDRWNGYDDALYAAARVLEILALDPRDSSEVFAALPDSPATPELLMPLEEGQPQAIMQRLFGAAAFEGAHINRTDGLRVEFSDGWGLVRASNTMPALSFRFEAENESRLEEIKALFRAEIQAVDPAVDLPF